MVKQYITTLKNGASEQKAHILGRNITLRDGEVVYEGILTKTFPSLFEEIVDVSIHTEVTKAGKAVVEAEAPETMLTEDSSDVQGVVEEAEEAVVEAEAEEAVVEAEGEEAVKKSNSKRAIKATKAK